MPLTDKQINNVGLFLTSYMGFHSTRRKQGLYIAHCFILLGCLWLEYLNRDITEYSIRMLTLMFHPYKLHRLFVFLSEKGFIVLARQDGRKRYYTLTDLGRSTAIDLLNGIEAKQTEFFNKHLSR